MTEATIKRPRTKASLVEPTSPTQWRAWKQNELPPVERIAPGVWCLPVTIPDHPMRFTFCYAILGHNGVILVDPGCPGDKAWESLLIGLATAGISVASIIGVVVTHAHPDHHGLTARVNHETGAWIAMHRLEAETMQRERVDKEQDHPLGDLRHAGIPAEPAALLLRTIADTRHEFAQYAPAKPTVLLEDGDLLDFAGTAVRVIWTPGHTPGSICLHDETNDILFTGDHVLPRISPNVGMHTMTDRSPLADYLSSLRRVAKFDSAHIAPGHEYRFDSLTPRLEALAAHHEDRLKEILDAVTATPNSTLWQIAAGISWSRGWDSIGGVMIFAALGETRAHLELLVARGALTIDTCDDGVSRFTAHADTAEQD